jgi:hypothetical protein
MYVFITGTPDSPNGIDYELYVTKKVWTKTVGGDDVIADQIFHYHQVRSGLILVTKNILSFFVPPNFPSKSCGIFLTFFYSL